MRLVVTGSIAYDYLMSFPGKFTEHFLPEHFHRVSLSFLVDTMDKRRGGCAPNIAYTLALLGERPLLMATAGEDFGEYRNWLEAAGVDTSEVKQVAGSSPRPFSAAPIRPTTRSLPSTPARWPTPASCRSGRSTPATWRSSRRTILERWCSMPKSAGRSASATSSIQASSARACRGDELADGVKGAAIVICNDYEFELLRQKTGLGEAEILERSEALVVTRGEHGSLGSYTRRGRADVPAVAPRRIVDPTGVGDAFRGGLMKGLALGLPYGVCARIGSVAATYALEHLGGQSHAYTWDEFTQRFESHFGPLPVGAEAQELEN